MQSPNAVELKYCERCGGLWLRRAGDPAVYCAPCAQRMNELPPPRPVRRAAAPGAIAGAVAMLVVLFLPASSTWFLEALA